MLKHLLGTNQLVHQPAEFLLCHAVHRFILMVTTLYEEVEAIFENHQILNPNRVIAQYPTLAVLGLVSVLASR